MQIWCSFASRSEEEQTRLTAPSSLSIPPLQGTSNNLPSQPPNSSRGCGQDHVAPPTPEQGFKRVESRIRAILRRNRHLPMVSGRWGGARGCGQLCVLRG